MCTGQNKCEILAVLIGQTKQVGKDSHMSVLKEGHFSNNRENQLLCTQPKSGTLNSKEGQHGRVDPPRAPSVCFASQVSALCTGQPPDTWKAAGMTLKSVTSMTFLHNNSGLCLSHQGTEEKPVPCVCQHSWPVCGFSPVNPVHSTAWEGGPCRHRCAPGAGREQDPGSSGIPQAMARSLHKLKVLCQPPHPAQETHGGSFWQCACPPYAQVSDGLRTSL